MDGPHPRLLSALSPQGRGMRLAHRQQASQDETYLAPAGRGGARSARGRAVRLQHLSAPPEVDALLLTPAQNGRPSPPPLAPPLPAGERDASRTSVASPAGRPTSPQRGEAARAARG